MKIKTDESSECPDRKQTGVNFVEIAHSIEEIYLTGGEPHLPPNKII